MVRTMIEKSPALHVLVVDDEPLIRWSVAETLVSDGHTVVEAGDGAAAIRAVNESARPFDVVLLDFRLPDSHDLTLLAHIRRRAPASAVVLMTAFSTPDVVDGAHALGVRQVLSKPFDLTDIAAIVRAAAA